MKHTTNGRVGIDRISQRRMIGLRPSPEISEIIDKMAHEMDRSRAYIANMLIKQALKQQKHINHSGK